MFYWHRHRSDIVCVRLRLVFKPVSLWEIFRKYSGKWNHLFMHQFRFAT